MDNEYELRYLPLFYEDMYEKVTYYRIYVKNFTVYYVVIPMGDRKIMEVRRFLYNRQDRDRIV